MTWNFSFHCNPRILKVVWLNCVSELFFSFHFIVAIGIFYSTVLIQPCSLNSLQEMHNWGLNSFSHNLFTENLNFYWNRENLNVTIECLFLWFCFIVLWRLMRALRPRQNLQTFDFCFYFTSTSCYRMISLLHDSSKTFSR